MLELLDALQSPVLTVTAGAEPETTQAGGTGAKAPAKAEMLETARMLGGKKGAGVCLRLSHWLAPSLMELSHPTASGMAGSFGQGDDKRQADTSLV